MDKLIIFAVCSLAVASAKAGPDDDWRIVNGTNATPGQFPHQISMRKWNQHVCGGAILNPTTILTAGHCVFNETIDDYTIVVGSTTLNSGGVSHVVTKFILHEAYNSSKFFNDIALVKIDSFNPITYTTSVQPVKLATENPPNNTQLTMSGWGYTTNTNPQSAPNNLQQHSTRSVDLQSCAEKMVGINTPVTSGHVCAFSRNGQGACSGDSGGPLINTSTKEQVGVASWVSPLGCGTGRPDIFTSVAVYRNWILRNGK